MAWIKRNLYFVIGNFIAFALMALGGYYLYQNYQANKVAFDDWSQNNHDLQELQNLKPHPGQPSREGNTNAVDNIRIAQSQISQLSNELRRAELGFVAIPPIPASTGGRGWNQTSFVTNLAATIRQLQESARGASVVIPSNVAKGYAFTFQAIRDQFSFAPESPQRLAAQLGETKAICDILFNAKINELVSLKRERVCQEDNSATTDDYLDETALTRDLGGRKVTVTPHEMTFNCFSTELAAVMSGFAASRYGFIVLGVDIMPAPAAVEGAAGGAPVNPIPSAGVGLSNELTAQERRDAQIRGGYAEVLAAEARKRQGLGARVAPTVTPRPTGPAVVINEKPVQVKLLVGIVRVPNAPVGGARGTPRGGRGN